MKRFNTIKKSRKRSKDIDEKIEYLNKECQKTGLQEVMTTSNVYVKTKEVPNTTYTDFQNTSIGGYALAISGADGNGAGGAILGTNSQGAEGVALSPPHPITGVRTSAIHLLDGIGTSYPLQPGKSVFRGFNNKYSHTMGGALWFFDSNYNFAGQQGRWLNFEWFNGGWGFWDTSFLGFYFHNQNLDQYELNGVNIGTQIKNQIAGINFGNTGAVGTPTTTVFVKNDLGDPGFLPINIDGVSIQAFNYLKGKAGANVSSSYYSPEDKKNVINYYKKLQANPNYQPKPYERESLIRQMRAQGDGTQIASTDLSTAFPPSPPDKEPVDTPPETPDEPPAPPESNPYPDEKADPAGLDARALKLGYNDPYYPVNPTGHYIAMVTTAQDILSAEMEAEFYSAAARGESPNYDTASINQAKEKVKKARANLDNWERWKRENNYIWKGPIDHAAEDQRRQAELEKQQKYETEKEKLEKAKEQAEADAEMHAAEAKKLLTEFGRDVFLTLFGPGALKLAGKALGKLPAISKFFKLGKAAQKAQIDDALRAAKKSADSDADEIFKALKNAVGGKTPTAAADDFLRFVNSDLMGRNISRAIKAGKKSLVIPYKGRNVTVNVDKLQQLRFKGLNYQQLFQSHKLEGDLLNEAAKLGHFEPEVLTVDLEKLRKGIMPEFPKDPPPEMIGGYSAKSKLVRKEPELPPFIKVTKKDLARNHRLTDKEISDFMNDIKMINDYIKKNPAELKYAMIRYPKDDPRLAQLNYNMDQMKAASDEYMNTHFPENQKLFNKLQDKIIRNIKQTDPKNFKGHKEAPKFTDEKTEVVEQRKKTVLKYFKKPVKIKKPFKY